jgi:predicted amidophosphoribosyltransferase
MAVSKKFKNEHLVNTENSPSTDLLRGGAAFREVCSSCGKKTNHWSGMCRACRSAKDIPIRQRLGGK